MIAKGLIEQFEATSDRYDVGYYSGHLDGYNRGYTAGKAAPSRSYDEGYAAGEASRQWASYQMGREHAEREFAEERMALEDHACAAFAAGAADAQRKAISAELLAREAAIDRLDAEAQRHRQRVGALLCSKTGPLPEGYGVV